MKTIQTATDIKDFEEMAAKATNMIEGEYIVRCAAKFVGATSPDWSKDFCAKNLGRFSKSECYRILMGEMVGNKRNYHYVPTGFHIDQTGKYDS